jgi:hypothetical protein
MNLNIINVVTTELRRHGQEFVTKDELAGILTRIEEDRTRCHFPPESDFDPAGAALDNEDTLASLYPDKAARLDEDMKDMET